VHQYYSQTPRSPSEAGAGRGVNVGLLQPQLIEIKAKENKQVPKSSPRYYLQPYHFTYYKKKPAAPAKRAIPAPVAFIAPPVKRGGVVLVLVALTLPVGNTNEEVALRLADRRVEVALRRTVDAVVVTWILDVIELKGLPVDDVGGAVRLVSRMSEIVSE
jgi:hypothetical protein